MVSNPLSQATPKSVHHKSKSNLFAQILESHVLTSGIKPDEMTYERLVEIAFLTAEFKNKATAEIVLQARAGELVILMKDSGRYDWDKTEAFAALKVATPPANLAACKKHKVIARPAARVKLAAKTTARRSLAALRQAETLAGVVGEEEEEEEEAEEEEEDEEEEEEEEEGANEGGKQPGSAKGKSVLRPRVSDYPVEPQGSPDEDEDEEVTTRHRDVGEGQSYAGAKRGMKHGGNSTEQLAKRYRSLHAQNTPTVARSVEPSTGWPPFVPGTGRAPLKYGTMLATFPNLPGGRWQCELHGCNFKVTEADTDDGRQIIEDHYAQHSRNMAKALDLVHEEAANMSDRRVE